MDSVEAAMDSEEAEKAMGVVDSAEEEAMDSEEEAMDSAEEVERWTWRRTRRHATSAPNIGKSFYCLVPNFRPH